MDLFDYTEFDNYVTFQIYSTDVTKINNLRKFICTKFSIYAIDTICVDINTSNLPDEFLAARLSLIPFISNHIEINEYVLTLNVSGIHNLYPSHFVGDIKSCNNDIIIAKLHPTQQISLTASVCLGYGSDHAKWKPVHTCYFTRTGNIFTFYVETTDVIDPFTLIHTSIHHVNTSL